MLMRKRGVLAWLFVVVMVFMTASFAFATSAIPKDKGTLQATYLIDEKPVESIEFQIYKVATYGNHGEFEWLDAFKDYRLAFDVHNVEILRTTAAALSSLVIRDGIPYIDKQSTDNAGSMTFANLDQGVYLITGESYTDGFTTYYPVPSLAVVYGYDVSNLELKHDSVYNPPRDTNVHVIKVWDDGGWEERPESVEVQLLRDGKEYDKVELSDRNNWRYTWRELDSTSVWTVVEVVPEGYELTIQRSGNNYTLHNHHDLPTPEPTPTPEEPSPAPSETPPESPEPSVSPEPTPTPTEPEPTPEIPTPPPTEPVVPPPVTSEPTPEPTPVVDPPASGWLEGETPIPSTPPGGPNLPQTGLQRLPVLILAAVGVVTIALGLIMRKRDS